jgi:hypothetical protein
MYPDGGPDPFEPLRCPHCETVICLDPAEATDELVGTHLAACVPAKLFARECATAALARPEAPRG